MDHTFDVGGPQMEMADQTEIVTEPDLGGHWKACGWLREDEKTGSMADKVKAPASGHVKGKCVKTGGRAQQWQLRETSRLTL